MRKYLPAALLAGMSGAVSVVSANEGATDLTWYGITLYGVIDAGISYQTHGSPLNGVYAQGLEYGISANSARSYAGPAPNGLTQSRIGLSGKHEFASGWAGIFTLERRANAARWPMTRSTMVT